MLAKKKAIKKASKKSVSIAVLLPVEKEAMPYALTALIKTEIDKYQNAGATAAPICSSPGKGVGTVSIVLSPFVKVAAPIFWRISNNVANFQRGRLFNNLGQKGYVVTSDGKKWYWGTNIKLTTLYPEIPDTN